MRRVLILTASYGSGHNMAARSLATAFTGEGAAVRVVDHFRELVGATFDRVSRHTYTWILRRAPAAWGLAYALGDRMSPHSALALGVPVVGTGRLAALLEATGPDIVVTVQATPAAAMSALARSGHRLPPHTTVVTDFVAHGQWIIPHVDRYCVAAEEVRHEYIARGAPADRIVVTGVPVRDGFERPPPPSVARAALGLSPHVPVILVMGGAHGRLGRLADVVEVLERLRAPLQALVVTGRDAELASALRRSTSDRRIRILGHVEDVPRLMAAADLLVTKAGGMTLAEALAAELPVTTYGSLPGQERANERFVSRAGVALVARSRADLARTLERALADPALLDHLRERMGRLRRPDASRRVVQAVLGPGALRP